MGWYFEHASRLRRSMAKVDKVQDLIAFLERYVDDKDWVHKPWHFPYLLRKPLRLWFEHERLGHNHTVSNLDVDGKCPSCKL